MSATILLEELAREQLGYELVPHPRTETAVDEAVALGVEQDSVGKTLVLTGTDGFARALIPSSHRLDLHKARTVLGGGKVHLASEAGLASAYPMFELGAVPPVGGPKDPLIVDRRLVEKDWIVVEAGTHEESIRLRTSDLIGLERTQVADLCQDD
jgi:Ala-tRNA(Pro) deacylase